MITLRDEYTVALGISALSVYVIAKLLTPPSLVHPLLLGRQSHVAPVRKQNESAVYGNYGNGSSPPPIAPGRGVTTQLTLLKMDSAEGSAERWLWDRKISNTTLMGMVKTMGEALCSAAGLVPKGSRVLMLLDDNLEWLISDLALASYCIPTITIASPSLLNEVLEKHPPNAILVQATFLHHLLELLTENDSTMHVVVVGDKTGEVEKWRSKVRVQLLTWEQVQKTSGILPVSSPPIAADISSAHFYAIENGELKGVQFTHQNVVAGANGVINIFPTSAPWSPNDTVVSAHGLSTPFGRSILYAALYAGANFTTLPSASILKEEGVTPSVEEVIRASEDQKRPPPTILFLTPALLEKLTATILRSSKRSWLHGLAWRQKEYSMLRGYLIKDGLWDRYVFGSARSEALGKVTSNLRAISVAGELLDSNALVPSRIAFSIPIINAYPHPMSASPIFASHPLDMQLLETTQPDFPDAPSKLLHCGPPLCNIEVKLTGINEDVVESGADPVGELCIRGPGVGDPVPMGVQLEDGWIDTGVKARARSNGTFVPIAGLRV